MASAHTKAVQPTPPRKNTHPKQGMSKKKKIITAVVASVAVLAVIAGIIVAVAAANWEAYKQYAADRKTVATCNGYEIPYEELRFVTLFYKDMLADSYGADIWDDPATAEQYRAELEELVNRNLNQNYVILSTCRHLGIKTTGASIDEYVDGQIDDLRSAFKNKAEFEAWIAEKGMTEHYLRFSIGISYLESAIYYTLLDNDMYAYSLNNVADFKAYVRDSGDYVRTVHVFIENVEGEDPAENLALAQAISDELQAISDPHDRLDALNEYIGSSINDDLMSLTGDGYYFTRHEMNESYEEAAFGLAIGEVSEPVVCSGGTFVMMRLAPEEEYIDKHVQELLDNYHSVAMGLYEDQFREDCTVTFNEYGQSIDLVNLQ